jgi:hypothetical protein
MEYKSEIGHHAVQMPSPTAWPLVLALGVALLAAGMVTSVAISVLGLVLALAASVGWFRSVLPAEAHLMVEVTDEAIAIEPSLKSLERLPRGPMHRKMIPVETFQLTTGLRDGIAGGIAMILPATIFSVLKFHSIWYAVNLMAAGGFVSWAGESNKFLSQFHLQGMLV